MKRLLLVLVFGCLVASSVAFKPHTTFALSQGDPGFESCEAIKDLSGSGDCNSDQADPARIGNVLRLSASIFAVVIGVIAIFVIFIAGVTIITSSGDSAKISKARDSIIYASIGLVIAALAQTIVYFVGTHSGG